MSHIQFGDLGMEYRATGLSVVFCLTSLGRVTVAATAIVLAAMSGVLPAAESEADRTVLPMPNTARPDLVVYDAKDPDAVFPAIHRFGLLKVRRMCLSCYSMMLALVHRVRLVVHVRCQRSTDCLPAD